MLNTYRLQQLPPSQCPDTFSIMVEPRPAGPVIGFYRDRPIAERVIDLFGRRFTYAGVIGRRRDGQYDVERLKSGQFIAEPGIVYDLEAGASRVKRDEPPEPAQPQPQEGRRVFAQIAATLALFLVGSLVIHLLLRAFNVG
jgi:hypothetical protein